MKSKWIHLATIAILVALVLVSVGSSAAQDQEGSGGEVRFHVAENFWADWAP